MKDPRDEFWDLAALIPPRSKMPPREEPIDLPLSSVTVTPHEAEKEKSERSTRLNFSFTLGDAEPVYIYTPDNRLLKEVGVYRRASRHAVFNGFRTEGAALLKERGSACEYVPFFSYIPQYNQLTEAQKAYYLYFRDEANAGRFLDAGQSYVLLYIYEIINLPEYIPPKIGVLRLAALWAAVYKRLPAVSKFLAQWLSDYALVHRVSCPSHIILPFIDEVLCRASLKEFYLTPCGEEGTPVTPQNLCLMSGYNYHAGRYTEANRDLFDTHICGVASLVFSHLFREGPSYETVTKKYETFSGALWAGAYRYELAVTYYSLTGTEGLRILMTAVTKYAENKLRAYLSIKSRLTVSGLPETYRALADAYFEEHLPKKEKEASEEALPEYEKLYEAQSVGVCTETADEIEQSSWGNTFRLISDEERDALIRESSHSLPSLAPSNPEEEKIPKASEAFGLSLNEIEFLRLIFEGRESEARAFSSRCDISYLSLGERINEAFCDGMGDVVLELMDGVYTVLEDYETEVGDFLSQ